MENVVELLVPLVVDIGVGPTGGSKALRLRAQNCSEEAGSGRGARSCVAGEKTRDVPNGALYPRWQPQARPAHIRRPMKRAVLPLITLGLFALVVADRLSHALGSARQQPAVQGPSDTRSATVQLEASSAAGKPADQPGNRPPGDRLARLAARQQLSREGGLTYLDSLIISTDSVVRRWPDRQGVPLRVGAAKAAWRLSATDVRVRA